MRADAANPVNNYCRAREPSLPSKPHCTPSHTTDTPTYSPASVIHGQSRAPSAQSYKSEQSKPVKATLDDRVQSMSHDKQVTTCLPHLQVKHKQSVPISDLLATEVPIEKQISATSLPTTGKTFPTEQLASVKKSPCMLGPDTTYSSPTKQSIQLQVPLALGVQQARRGEACRLCGKFFERRYEKRRHEKTHTAQPHFRCSDASCMQKGKWGFTQRHNFRKHMQEQHGVFVD